MNLELIRKFISHSPRGCNAEAGDLPSLPHKGRTASASIRESESAGKRRQKEKIQDALGFGMGPLAEEIANR